VAQEWLGEHCPDFIDKNCWPPNSPDLNPLDHHVWGAMLEKFSELKPKPQNVAELKTALLTIRDDLLNETVRKYVLRFRKRLGARIKAEGGHFEHSLNVINTYYFLLASYVCATLQHLFFHCWKFMTSLILYAVD